MVIRKINNFFSLGVCIEEALMKKVDFQGYKGNEKEHQFMLEKLIAIHNKINNNDWKQADIEDFVDKWA